MQGKTTLAIALAILVAWLFRYEPIGQSSALLDRWTGNVVIPKVVNKSN